MCHVWPRLPCDAGNTSNFSRTFRPHPCQGSGGLWRWHPSACSVGPGNKWVLELHFPVQGLHTNCGSQHRFKSQPAHSGPVLFLELWGPWTHGPASHCSFPPRCWEISNLQAKKGRGLGSSEEAMRAGIFIWSWLGLGRKGGVHMQGDMRSSLGPHPLDIAGD